MPAPAEELAQDNLGLNDDLFEVEDIGEEVGVEDETAAPAGSEAVTTEDPAVADPEWKTAGFSSEGDYFKAVAREREAELKTYREDKNIQAYKAQQEYDRQQQAQAEYNRQQQRIAAQQQEDTEWQALLTAHGIPPEHQGLFHGMRKLQEAKIDAIEKQRQQDMETLYGLTEQRVSQVEQPITAALLERDFLASYPPEMHIFKDDALEDYRIARQLNATHEQAKHYAAERIERRKAKYGINPSAKFTGTKPNLHVARTPGLESTDTAGAPPATDKTEMAAMRSTWKKILGDNTPI